MRKKLKNLLLVPALMVIASAFVISCGDDDDNNAPIPPAPIHESVQLWAGGPKWATCNVGATKPEEYGLFFAWGETTGYTSSTEGKTLIDDIYTGYTDRDFSWASYTKFGTFDTTAPPNYGFTKYNKTNGPTTLESADDAATVSWGSEWRMPTAEEWQALLDNTTSEWTDNYSSTGIAGRIFTGKGDYSNISIFLPTAGWRYATSLSGQGRYGLYWSSSLGEGGADEARTLNFGSGYLNVSDDYRSCGYSVRPVLAQ